MHGIYIVVNHAWIEIKSKLNWHRSSRFRDLLAWLLTFIAVVAAWVFFRADSFSSAWEILSGMSGFNGVSLPKALAGQLSFLSNSSHLIQISFDGVAPRSNINAPLGLLYITVGMLLVLVFPNVHQTLGAYKTTWEDIVDEKIPQPLLTGWFASISQWRPTAIYAIATSVIFALCLFEIMANDKPSPFLYFQF